MSYTLHGLLERSARIYPEHPAVVDGDRSLTYAELNAAANRLAHTLENHGVGRGSRVGLYLDKSLEAVIGLYGVLKTGAAYVSIDVKAPTSRSGYIVGNCGIEVLVSVTERRGAWSELAEQSDLTTVIVMDGDAEPVEGLTLVAPGELDAASDADPDARAIDQDLAYIIYTSGSTGAPKGVKLTHRNALVFVNWTVDEYGITHDDRLSSHAPFHFDLSILDLYSSAHAGATLFLVPAMASVFPVKINRFISEHRITVWYSVPSILSMVLQRGKLEQDAFPDLRWMLFAGEVFPTRYLSELMSLLPHVRFSNLYGPTETNVCTFYNVPEIPDLDGGDIPIGRPIPNTDGYVVGEDGALVARGEVGELWIRSGTVMAGYWGDPERTSERLVPDPFAGEIVDPVYKTGDLVREDENGDYTFLGRRDNQIKSRGYRIELGEIETAMYKHPGVVEFAVVAVPDDLVTNRLFGFATVKEGVSVSDLLHHCKEAVPPYMIPEHFELLEVLPKTSTGKINRQQLKQSAEGVHL
jgi:amino acid adenylation domain-containing protein